MIFRPVMLDGAQGLLIVGQMLLVHVLATILIEGFVLYKMGYRSFIRSCVDAFLLNLVSLAGGILYLIWSPISQPESFSGDAWRYAILLILFVETLLVEGLLLRALQPKLSWPTHIKATLLMNVITYILLAIILWKFQ